jgi:hypothetical protein
MSVGKYKGYRDELKDLHTIKAKIAEFDSYISRRLAYVTKQVFLENKVEKEKSNAN